MDYNEDDFKKSCKEVVDRVQVNDEFAEKIKRQYSQKMSKKERFNGHAGLVFAAIAISVLVLGGGAVYALNSPAIKSAFFGENENAFEEVYQPEHKEYVFENNKIVLDGEIYDKELGLVYLSFELQTLDGTPIEQVHKEKGHVEFNFIGKMPNIVDSPKNENESYSFYKLCVGNTDVGIVFRNINGWSGYREGSHYFIKIFQKKEQPSDVFDEFKYSVITKEDFNSMVQEIENLGPEYYIARNHGYPVEEFERLFGSGEVKPEVREIMNKYMPFESIDYKEMNVQPIDTDKCKLAFGRTDFMINYNQKDCHKSLYMVREDGSIFIILGDESMLLDEDKEKTIVNKKERYCVGSVDNITGESILRYEYGVILDENEKVYVVADGVKYE